VIDEGSGLCDCGAAERNSRSGPGAITDEQARTFDVPLTLPDAGKRYHRRIYADGPGADWLTIRCGRDLASPRHEGLAPALALGRAGARHSHRPANKT